MIKKILITGGAGFIGSNLCERLAEDLNNVIYSLDNYSTGSKSNHVPNVTYIEGETADIAELINFSPDTVYHCDKSLGGANRALVGSPQAGF
jgi:UDP-glucose 4-epimerase